MLFSLKKFDDSGVLAKRRGFSFLEHESELIMYVLLFRTEGGFGNVFDNRLYFFDAHGSFGELVGIDLWYFGEGEFLF
jgi:hypothetical protein